MSSDNPKVKAIFIMEVLGRPPEHLTQVLEGFVKKIDEEKGVSVKDKKIKEPAQFKDKKDFFTSFAEIELETEDLKLLLGLIFKYMPAHIEILSPENLTMTNNNVNELFNELTRRLHGYDEIARVVTVEKNILAKKLQALMGKDKNDKNKSSTPAKTEDNKKE